MMRLALVAITAILAAQSAWALENFIPLGQNYSPGDSVLPELNSYEDRLNANVDIYESQRRVEQRFQVEQGSYLRRFQNEQELTGGDYSIDY
jgi:hypothetical protein